MQGGSLSSALTKAVHRFAHEKLSQERDNHSRGWRRYLEWEQKKWKQQHYEYYDDELFRCCYTISKLPWSVGISEKALEAVSNVEAVNQLLLSSRSGVCVGCGPGSDAIALLARRHHGSAAPLVLFLVDRCGGWRPQIACLDEQLREQRLPYSLWFKAGCVKSAEDAVRLLPDTDLLVLSFAHSVNAEPQLWPHLAARYKLVLVIDITSEALADALKRAGFTACQIESQSAVSIFYHLVSESDETEASQPVSAEASQSVSAEASQPVSAEASQSVSAEASQPVSAEASQSVSAEASQSVSAEASESVSAEASQPVSAEASQSVSAEVASEADLNRYSSSVSMRLPVEKCVSAEV